MPPNWFDMVYPRHSPSMLSIDYAILSPTSVEAPAGTSSNNNNNNNTNVRWSSLFPSAPVVLERPEEVLLRSSAPEESVSSSSPMSSRARSVVSYACAFLRIRVIFVSLTLWHRIEYTVRTCGAYVSRIIQRVHPGA